MAGMYPNNQTIEIFGEQISWPGVDATGKFTNGSFSDPMVKPSFIPAETMNLILDNLESIITKCGGMPNAISKTQLADALLKEIKNITPHSYGLYSEGRDLRQVLGIESTNPAVYIPLIMQELHRRCNGAGVADFSGIKFGDYIDGLDLSGIAAAPGGTAPQAWSDIYKNNRIMVIGLNPYKSLGLNQSNVFNSIILGFQNIICLSRMNETDTNNGGYPNSELRIWLEGANGDGSGVFSTALKTALGGNYLYTLQRYSSGWKSFTVWPPSEFEFTGRSSYNNNLTQIVDIHLPIYQDSINYNKKYYNGVRTSFWLSSIDSNSVDKFCVGYITGSIYSLSANTTTVGVAPVFSVC